MSELSNGTHVRIRNVTGGLKSSYVDMTGTITDAWITSGGNRYTPVYDVVLDPITITQGDISRIFNSYLITVDRDEVLPL